jgi:exodeoxyribonuclease VII large subunit
MKMSSVLPEFTVSEISLAIKRVVEDGFSYIKVKGEISGLKAAASGHIYFSLKDSNAVLNCVCWRGKVAANKVNLADGLEVVCLGSVTAYPGRSSYQLVVEDVQPAGVGALLALFEKRKKDFAEAGFFAAERKRPLPLLPRRIGVVTSPTGAVIRDILHRIEERFPTEILIIGVLVQGEGAAKQIANGIRRLNSLDENKPDIIIIARGGGSIEDLWAFNEDEVLYAAIESAIPIISAIGHETDYTLLDFIADKRAPTPTAAAEMAVPVRLDLQHKLGQFQARSQALLKYNLSLYQNKMGNTNNALQKVRHNLEILKHKLDNKSKALNEAVNRYLKDKDNICRTAGRLLDAHNYKNILKRGYSILRAEDGKIIYRCEKAIKCEKMQAELQDGMIQLYVR